MSISQIANMPGAERAGRRRRPPAILFGRARDRTVARPARRAPDRGRRALTDRIGSVSPLNQPPLPPPPVSSPSPPYDAGSASLDRRSAAASEWKPWATRGLIAANVAAFGFEVARTGSLNGPSAQEMIALGGNFGPLSCSGESWRLASAMFLHYGAIHLGMNMVCLYQIAVVERLLGRAQFLALYLAAGLVGGFASVATFPHSVSAGASGAVFGMFGAFTAIMVVRRKQIDPGTWRQTMRSLGTFFAINLAFGLSQRNIDMSAHVAGLGTGFVGAWTLTLRAAREPKPWLRAIAVVLAGAAIAFGGLYALPR